ncbi:MAG: hypothetical protein ACRDRH_18150 [Pseudonocardia sp.]
MNLASGGSPSSTGGVRLDAVAGRAGVLLDPCALALAAGDECGGEGFPLGDAIGRHC